MRNKRLALMTLLLAMATPALTQENIARETQATDKAQVESQKSESLTDAVDQAAVGTATAAPSEGSTTEEPSITNTELGASEPASTVDDYRATERISEDRSVSFPVDI